MTQNQKILKHLKSGRSITPYTALALYQCFRLAARIADLRRAGYTISDEWYNIPRSKKRVKKYMIK